jgi:hypothetical protein
VCRVFLFPCLIVKVAYCNNEINKEYIQGVNMIVLWHIEIIKDGNGRNFVILESVVFKLCAAALRGAARNSKGAANFFRQLEILQFFHQNLADFSFKSCLMFFIVKNKPIFYKNSLRASHFKFF